MIKSWILNVWSLIFLNNLFWSFNKIYTHRLMHRRGLRLHLRNGIIMILRLMHHMVIWIHLHRLELVNWLHGIVLWNLKIVQWRNIIAILKIHLLII